MRGADILLTVLIVVFVGVATLWIGSFFLVPEPSVLLQPFQPTSSAQISTVQEAINNLGASITFVDPTTGNCDEVVLEPNDADAPGDLNSPAGSCAGSTQYNIAAGPNNNAPIKVCVKALPGSGGAGNLIGTAVPANFIALSAESFDDASTAAGPVIGSQNVITTTGQDASTEAGSYPSGMNANQIVHYRFWLDVPASIAADTYTNTLNFAIVPQATVCSTT